MTLFYNQKLGPQINLNFPNWPDRLPADVETTLFRIVEEALTNIDRHSGSAAGEICFHKKSGELLLEVADHGSGIFPEMLKQLNRGTALPGIGIAGMRERVRLLGGRMEICSSSSGTAVRVKLPINRPPVGGGRRSAGVDASIDAVLPGDA